ncbi:hypothetical protein O3M35_000525 [Rhynocoris fuscipes]|uniref:Uncharacterized protein n=1 Tax=Rhynocoris fuscipes TaxID=488301 RepID=A0AAW1DSV4_9HEMI
MSLEKVITEYVIVYPDTIYSTLKTDTREIVLFIKEALVPFLIYLGKMICLSRIWYWNSIRYRFNKTKNYIENVTKEIKFAQKLVLKDLDPDISENIEQNIILNIDQTLEIIQSAQSLALPWYNHQMNGIEIFTCVSTTLAAQMIRTYSKLTALSDMPLINKYQALCDLEYASVCLNKLILIDETVSLFIITAFEFLVIFLL